MALLLLQDRLEAQPVRFMETDAMLALHHAQLALAGVSWWWSRVLYCSDPC